MSFVLVSFLLFLSKVCKCLNLIIFSCYRRSTYVDVTAVLEMDREFGASEHAATFTKCQTVNEHFASMPRNPFGLFSADSGSSSCDSDSDSEELSGLDVYCTCQYLYPAHPTAVNRLQVIFCVPVIIFFII